MTLWLHIWEISDDTGDYGNSLDIRAFSTEEKAENYLKTTRVGYVININVDEDK
jgi:hypothetical protein